MSTSVGKPMRGGLGSGVVLAALLCLARPGFCTEPLYLSGPPVAESLVLAVMAGENLAGKGVRFIPWHSPDQARALIAAGKVQGMVITTSGAATFFNRGVRTGIAGVFDVPVWVVSAGKRSRAPGQVPAMQRGPGNPLAGTILFPFGRGEMPGLLFSAAMGELTAGLAVRHTGGALEAVNLLLIGRADHALLAEPAASLAVAKSRGRDGIRLFKNLDLRQEWERKFDGRPLFVSALCLFGSGLDRPGRIRDIVNGYGLARTWIENHPGKARKIAARQLPALGVTAENKGPSRTGGALVTGKAAFDATRFFLEKIFERDPGAVGGKLPGPELFMDMK